MLRGSEGHFCRRGEIWMVSLDPAVGHEQARTRPALVLSVDAGEVRRGHMVTIVPITSRERDGLRTRIPIAPPEGGLVIPGQIIGEQVRTISTRRLLRLMGVASGKTVDRVCGVVRDLLGL